MPMRIDVVPCPSRPVRVAVVDDFELVVAGVARMLEPHAHLVDVVELEANKPVDSDVDVALFDTFAQAEAHQDDVQEVIDNPHAARVAVYTWNFSTELVEAALGRGAVGYLSKGLHGGTLAQAIARIHAGEIVVAESGRPCGPLGNPGDWPGRLHGLTEREAEILALLVAGCSNAEVGQTLYISVNSVKTHLKALYRKVGVHRRTQAVSWGMQHGFLVEHRRLVDWRIDAAVERAQRRVEPVEDAG